jgi:hypothetical protein
MTPPKSKKSRLKTKQERELREELWPDLDPDDIWDRSGASGFATLPRTLPLVMRVIDSLTSGKPGSTTYLELWCRANDLGYIQLHGRTDEIAYASGFSGPRKVNTWEARLTPLAEHGFIRLAPGGGKVNGYALILNPYFVIHKLNIAGKVSPDDWVALFERANRLKATDLTEAKDRYSAPTKPNSPDDNTLEF